jgi:hypothetical protein
VLNQCVPSSGTATPRIGVPRLPVWSLVPAAALAWWAGGYLFWLLEGLEDRFVPGTAGTLHLAVPLLSSLLGLLVTGALVGGVAAGLLGMVAGPERRLPAGAATFVGAALAVIGTLIFSANRLREAAGSEFDGERPVVLGLSLVVVVLALVGWGAGAGALLGRPGAGLAVAVLAGLVPSWTSAVLFTVIDPDPYTGATTISYVSQWLGAAVLLVGLVLVGIRPAARLLWWPLLTAAAWLLGSFLTAVSYLSSLLRPGAGLPRSLPDSLDATLQVFGAASNPASRYVDPWIVAVVAAVVVAIVLDRRRRTPDVTAAPATLIPSSR